MRPYLFLATFIVPLIAHSQTPVLVNPSGTQSIAQPAGSNLDVNRFESIRFADQFPGADIGAKVDSAIADLGSNGGVVEIPAGSYTFGTTITVNQNSTWVRCQGWGTILTYSGSGTAVVIGNSSSPGSTPATISAAHFSNCTLRGSGGGTGIYIEGGMTSGNFVDHINFDSGGNGFQTFIEEGDTSDCTPHCNFDNYIQENQILMNNPLSTSYAGVGIDAPFKAHNLVIRDNIIQDEEEHVPNGTDGSICVRVASASSIKIIDNNIEGCGVANVQVGLTAVQGVQAYGTIVDGNYFEPLEASTINVDVGADALGTVVADNYMNGMGVQSYMIQLEDCSYGTVIQNNTQVGIGQAGAVVDNLTHSCGNAITIAGNRFNGSTYIHGTAGLSYWQNPDDKSLTLGSVTFGNLPSASSSPNGTLIYCSNCSIAPTCGAGGTGAIAKRINGAWVCD